MQLIHLFLTITATTAATVNSHLSQSRGSISALDFGHRNPSPELFTEAHKVAGRADASDETHEVISWIGSGSESDDPKDLARGLIDNAFDALIKACGIDENSKLGETLVQIVKLECECVSVTGYLGTHLVRALGDIALKATEGLVGGGIEDSLDGLRNQFRNKMTAVAEELFAPEANCGTDASTTADDIDIGNIGENENSTIEDVLGSLSTDGCRCLSSTLYLAIHLLRAYFEVKLDILAAILGGSLHPLANLLDDLKDLLHQVLFAAGEIIRPDNVCHGSL
ncbi:Alcohol dehydrogenase GroES-like domain family protein [Aspergillus niger]|uniref:Alcohol dehydrogenase GroES-like domain family protein n=1 Tax=Aspergillus niger TaxID=5061 RepID=A0A505HUF9_ASPNG|nr:Alcohol dehydrogenase GroES-like domain family protein [Aspergillus niger]